MSEQEIFDRARQITDAQARHSYLQEACGDDAALLRRVLSRCEAAFQQPPAGPLSGEEATIDSGNADSAPPEVDSTHAVVGDMQIGGHIGPYKLLQRIGEGGMGVVWMAEQAQPVKRLVALKIIKAGMDTAQVVARFEAERQALAIMNHPNIAKVLDAGATQSGRPYFVMELVRGKPITEYCDQEHIESLDRIELFIHVCQAVQHAHHKGIIHRDIKPSNVLVSMIEDEPVVKVIDFGLAKATSQRLTEKTLFTAIGQIVGTPAYMSPEQAETDGLDIDTRTDVYSLGVLLYELLTGVTPIQSESLRQAAFGELKRLICEQEPPLMSQKLSSLGERSASVAKNRSTDSRRLLNLLRGDLDVIVLKALEKQRSRRYESPSSFADDLRRYLNREPIEARPPSAVYRLRKLAERNRGKFIAASFVLLAMIVGLIGTAFGLLEARRQTQVAEANLKTAEENYELARKSVDRYFTLVSENTLLNEPHMEGLRKELLLSASDFYDEFVQRRSDDPKALADLAGAYVNLGEISWKTDSPEDGIARVKAAREAYEHALQASDAPDLHVHYSYAGYLLAGFYREQGRYDEAIAILNEVIEHVSNKATSDNQADLDNLRARSLRILAEVLRRTNQAEAALEHGRDSIDLFRELVRKYPNESQHQSDLALGLQIHAVSLYEKRENEASLELLEEAIATRRKLLQENPNSVGTKQKLASVLTLTSQVMRRLGQMEDALKSSNAALDLARELVRDHPELTSSKYDLTSTLTNHGNIQQVLGQPQEALKANLESVSILKDLSTNYPEMLNYTYTYGVAQANLGNTYLGKGEFLTAVDWYNQSTQCLQPLLESGSDPRVKRVMRNNHWGRADAFVALEKYPDAIAAYDETIEFAEEQLKSEVRLAKAMVIARTGDIEETIRIVETETARPDAPNFLWFDGARALMQAWRTVEEGNTRSDTEKAAEKSKLEGLTIGALRKALELDYLKAADAQSPLLSDEFAALKSNQEFQQLLQDAKLDDLATEDDAASPDESL